MKQFSSKALFAVVVFGCFALQAMSSPITRQQAQQNAQNFMIERGKSVALASLHHEPLCHDQFDEQSYYIFNIGENQDGYVIASGDDCLPAVLGYAEKGFIDVNNIPCNMKAWLDGYANQIQFLKEHGLIHSCTPKKNISQASVGNLLTCNWGQSDPFNRYCPIDPLTGLRSVTGCVATAMAQVMYYHRNRSVNHTTEEIPAYTTQKRGIVIDAIPTGSFIDWDNMIDQYENGNSSEIQKQAVAYLMKYCGAAVNMDYASGASSAYGHLVVWALPTFFNYSSHTRIVHRNCYSDEDWETLIYNELSKGRPVYYMGQTITDTHAFVCDGYDGNGYYHFNWGWPNAGFSSSPDGYFVLTLTDSDDLLMPYTSGQVAIINAEPRETMPSSGEGICFADPMMRYLCLINFDENDDGVLSEEEAAAITCFELKDKDHLINLYGIVNSFDEFKYFTGVTHIDNEFSVFSSMSSISIPNSVTTIGDNAFRDCVSLANITLPETLKTIGVSAFRNCACLKGIEIPENVTNIGDFAFSLTGLMSITIPRSVTSIGQGVFLGSINLKNMKWNAKDCLSFNIPKTVEHLSFGYEIEVIPSKFAYDCNQLRSVVIPNSVTTISERAFGKCTGLKSVTLPSSITILGYEAFSQCTSLESLTVNTDTIGKKAFSGCSGLKSVTLGKKVSSIDIWAFDQCENLTTVTSLAHVPPQMLFNSFDYDYDNQIIKVPTLRVPIDALDTYRDTWPWCLFGSIVGIDPSQGDVNLDDEVNIADLNAIVDNILNNGDDFMCDVNCDDEVNIADINAILSIILNNR